MERAEFARKIQEIRGDPETEALDRPVTVIFFTDGERHLTHAWTVETGDQSVRYVDVHCEANSSAIEVPYRVIADVQDYSKTG